MRIPRSRYPIALSACAVALSLLSVTPATAGPEGAAPAPGAAFGFTPGSDGLGDPYYPKDGNGGYDVQHYDVAIDYNPSSRALTGKTTITAQATQSLSAFDLDYAGPAVKSVSVNGQKAQFKKSGEHELVITPSVGVVMGTPLVVIVDYSGTMSDTSGNGWTLSPSGGAFAAGEPHSATTWYPLNDTPLDKATFTLHATVPTGWDVASNGVRTSDTPGGSNKHTVTWEEKTPIIGYLTTVAIDKFTRLEQKRSNGTSLESFFAPGAAGQKQSLEKNLPKVLDFEEQLYGPYPLDSGGGIYVDTNLQFSLETQTRPIYAPWTDLNTLVHENAHQWWGDAMSVQQWKDVCLNECFASFTADIMYPERVQGANPDQIYRRALATADQRGIWATPLYDPGVGKEFTTVYTRGPLFLHALRRSIGDNVFFPAVKEFVQSHRNGNASIPEFRKFIQSKTTNDLTGFFDAWLNGRKRPADQYLYPGPLHPSAPTAAPEQRDAQPDWPFGQGDRK
ncbi:M1 family metallopeptidase [Nocardia pseudobrasiliensis]|uniref:Aminopeptidase N n=1 Tax=Nocardia pseudobrasiliensis TaxID=45979 RepID=A0A370IAV6_9NOCA|nr:M1 family metallopeptidase [Nocardia pseudobrasiliensis]RDI67853.1 peptidase M1-like protein [Nocardia pseudobrasiliensis]